MVTCIHMLCYVMECLYTLITIYLLIFASFFVLLVIHFSSVCVVSVGYLAGPTSQQSSQQSDKKGLLVQHIGGLTCGWSDV